MAAYDAIVIGIGTAGSSLAERLARCSIHPTVSEVIPTMLGELVAVTRLLLVPHACTGR